MSAQDDRSALEVLHNIFSNIQDIGLSEVRLVKTEIEESVAEVKKPAAALGAGLILAGYAGGLLLVGLVFALAQLVAMWAATLLVGAFAAIIAAVLIVCGGRGVSRIHTKAGRTITGPRERVQWATHRRR